MRGGLGEEDVGVAVGSSVVGGVDVAVGVGFSVGEGVDVAVEVKVGTRVAVAVEVAVGVAVGSERGAKGLQAARATSSTRVITRAKDRERCMSPPNSKASRRFEDLREAE